MPEVESLVQPHKKPMLGVCERSHFKARRVNTSRNVLGIARVVHQRVGFIVEAGTYSSHSRLQRSKTSRTSSNLYRDHSANHKRATQSRHHQRPTSGALYCSRDSATHRSSRSAHEPAFPERPRWKLAAQSGLKIGVCSEAEEQLPGLRKSSL